MWTVFLSLKGYSIILSSLKLPYILIYKIATNFQLKS